MKMILMAAVSMLLVCGTMAEATDYRTFSASDLSVANAIAKEVIGVEGKFVFTNSNTVAVNALFVEFSVPLTALSLIGSFTDYESQNMGGKDLIFSGGIIPSGNDFTLQVSATSKHLQVNKWWWLNNGKKVGATQPKLLPALVYGKLAMPNVANVRNSVFSSKIITLKVGVPQPSQRRKYGWVSIRTSFDALNSLINNGSYHFGQPRGFSKMYNGASFRGELKCLTPLMENNKLFADLLALKFNILASEQGITPAGFGELYYNDQSSPYYSKTIRQIAAHADSMMTFWRGVFKADYIEIDTLISQINSSYVGPIDTISYSSKFMLTGVQSVSANVFSLTKPRLNPITQDNTYDNLPQVSELRQNYPNPFNPSTVIGYSLTVNSYVTIKIYNILGEEVVTIVDGLQEAGSKSVTWDASTIPSGTYMYRLTTGTFTDFKKMSLVK